MSQTFGNMEFFQQKKKLESRIDAALISLVSQARANPQLCDLLSRFRRSLNPVEGVDDGRLPGGQFVKHDFVCRTDRRQECLLVFLRYAVEQWWAFVRKERDSYEVIASLLTEIAEKYGNKSMKVVGSVRHGFTFDVLAELTGAGDEQD